MSRTQIWIVEYKARRNGKLWHPSSMFYSRRAATTRAAERQCSSHRFLFRATKYVPEKL